LKATTEGSKIGSAGWPLRVLDEILLHCNSLLHLTFIVITLLMCIDILDSHLKNDELYDCDSFLHVAKSKWESLTSRFNIFKRSSRSKDKEESTSHEMVALPIIIFFKAFKGY